MTPSALRHRLARSVASAALLANVAIAGASVTATSAVAATASASPAGTTVAVGDPIAITFYLPLRNAAGAEAQARSIQSAGSAGYHKFITGVTAAPGKPAHRVAFFLDEFGQLGRMDRLADSVTLLRGYGAQLWLFVQDLSQLKAVYPRWQSFLANTSQQFFGTADFDTARYLSGALGQQTIRFATQNVSQSSGTWGKPGNSSSGTGEHLQARSLLTPDEVMRLGPTRPIVLVSGEPPYLLNRVSYLTDSAYAGRFDANPLHLPHAAE